MNALQFTVRMEPALHERLKLVSEVTKTSMNQIALEGIQMELELLRAKCEWDLKKTLRKIERYKRRDPGFTRAIRAFAQAEVENEDPLEGELLDSEPRTLAQRQLRALLDGA